MGPSGASAAESASECSKKLKNEPLYDDEVCGQRDCSKIKQKTWDNFVKSVDAAIAQLDLRQKDLKQLKTWNSERFGLRRLLKKLKRKILEFQGDFVIPKYQEIKGGQDYATTLLWRGTNNKFDKPPSEEPVRHRDIGIQFLMKEPQNFIKKYDPIKGKREEKSVRIWQHWIWKAWACMLPENKNSGIKVEKLDDNGKKMIEEIIAQDQITIQTGIKALTDLIGKIRVNLC